MRKISWNEKNDSILQRRHDVHKTIPKKSRTLSTAIPSMNPLVVRRTIGDGEGGGRIIEDERIENERLCEGIGQPRS